MAAEKTGDRGIRKSGPDASAAESPQARASLALLFTTMITVALASPAVAVNGDLDRTFGGDGKVLTRFPAGDASTRAVAIQADGKIVAAGAVSTDTEVRFALARYLAS